MCSPTITEGEVKIIREKYDRLDHAIDEALRLVTMQLDLLRENQKILEEARIRKDSLL